MANVRVEIEGQEYPSIKAAAGALGCSNGYVGHRVNSDDHPEWKRLPAEPPKPKPVKNPADPARFSIATTHGRKFIFEQSLEVLGTNAEDFIHLAMLQASLSAITVLENDCSSSVDVHPDTGPKS